MPLPRLLTRYSTSSQVFPRQAARCTHTLPPYASLWWLHPPFRYYLPCLTQGCTLLSLMDFLSEVTQGQLYPLHGLPRWLRGKESTCNAGNPGSVLELGRSSGVGNSSPLQYSCKGNPVDKGALGGWHYSSWGLKKSNTTQQLNHHHLSHRQLLQTGPLGHILPPTPHISSSHTPSAISYIGWNLYLGKAYHLLP